LIYGFINDRDLIEKLRIKAKLFKAEKDIAYLVGKKAVIEGNIDRVDGDIDLIDQEIDKVRSEIRENVSRIEKLSPDEKLDRFKELGY
jgi:hypothetical protein